MKLQNLVLATSGSPTYKIPALSPPSATFPTQESSKPDIEPSIQGSYHATNPSLNSSSKSPGVSASEILISISQNPQASQPDHVSGTEILSTWDTKQVEEDAEQQLGKRVRLRIPSDSGTVSPMTPGVTETPSMQHESSPSPEDIFIRHSNVGPRPTLPPIGNLIQLVQLPLSSAATGQVEAKAASTTSSFPSSIRDPRTHRRAVSFPEYAGQRGPRIYGIPTTNVGSSQLSPSTYKPKFKFTEAQKKILLAEFEVNQYPNHDKKEELGRLTGTTATQVQFWFQNQRQKMVRLNNTVHPRQPNHDHGVSQIWELGKRTRE